MKCKLCKKEFKDGDIFFVVNKYKYKGSTIQQMHVSFNLCEQCMTCQ